MTTSRGERVPVGLVYRNPRLYRLAMRLLDRHADEDLRMVADRIEPGSHVLDLCCGDAAIARLLLAKRCRYVGLELNERFVADGRRRRSEEHTSELQSHSDLVCRLLLEKK